MSDQAGDTGAEARLALGEPELRLPWLESADEDMDEGLDWSRIGKFAGFVFIFALVVIGAALFLRGYLDAAPEGDGSLIEAPDAPYKVRPKDPGGMTVAGTGDTSYKVGEGVDDEARLADPEPLPSAAPTPTASASATPEPPLIGVAVQIGAYSTEADARSGWDLLRGRYEPLKNYDRRIVQGRADIGTVFRLQAVASNAAGAFALCDDMRRNGIECQVKR